MIKAAYGRVVVYIYMGSLTLTSINRIILGLGIKKLSWKIFITIMFLFCLHLEKGYLWQVWRQWQVEEL